MDTILVPGLWLDADSWDATIPALHDAGHRVYALTMPGVGASAVESSSVGMSDWVDAVIHEIDARESPVVLVGHSAGGNVAWAAADARSEQVAAVLLIDTVPPPDGARLPSFPTVDGVVPFPGWDFFDDADIADLDEETRELRASLALSVPVRVTSEPVHLASARRFSLPVVMLMGSDDETSLRKKMQGAGSYADELNRITDLTVTRLDTGHWPQFSRPVLLGQTIAEAVDRHSGEGPDGTA